MRNFAVRLSALTATATLAGGLALAVSGTAAAAGNPSTTGTGQPSQSCLSSTAPSEPGNAASAPGSAFNEPTDTSPGGTAGQVYAGNGVSAGTANSGNAVSQYDVACYQVSQPH
jgi:hypothetical protein